MAYHVRLKDKRYLLTESDYLINADAWDNEIRDWLADKAGVELAEEHIDAIEFIRATYQKRKQHPNPRVIAADLAKKYGPDKGTLRHFNGFCPKRGNCRYYVIMLRSWTGPAENKLVQETITRCSGMPMNRH